MVIVPAILLLGVWAPWVQRDQRLNMAEWLPREIVHVGLTHFSSAVTAVLIIAGGLAMLGAILRVWGAAWLGPATVIHLNMKAGPVTASGPYRYFRNPLYIGLWCMAAVIALLMLVISFALLMIINLFQSWSRRRLGDV